MLGTRPACHAEASQLLTSDATWLALALLLTPVGVGTLGIVCDVGGAGASVGSREAAVVFGTAIVSVRAAILRECVVGEDKTVEPKIDTKDR